MPEDAQPPLVLLGYLQSSQHIIDTQKLVVFGNQFDQRAACIAKERKILHDIYETPLLAGATDDRLKRDNALFFFVADLLPLEEMLPTGRHAANLALVAVRQNDKGVVAEDMRNGVLVVA